MTERRLQTRSDLTATSLGLSLHLLRRFAGVRVAAAPYGSAGGDSSSTLAAHQFWLQRQRVLHHEPHPSDADIIELNCGGSIMVTSRSTLRQVRI